MRCGAWVSPDMHARVLLQDVGRVRFRFGHVGWCSVQLGAADVVGLSCNPGFLYHLP